MKIGWIGLWMLAAAGGVAWLLLLFSGWIDAPHWLAADRVLPAGVLPIPGLLVGLAFGALIARTPPATNAAGLPSVLAAATIITLGLLGALLLAGVQGHSVKPLPAAIVLVGATLTLLVGVYAVDAVRRSEGVLFESHWGGLGGGLGGLRISAAAVLLFFLLVLSSATILLAIMNPNDLLRALLAPSGKPAAEATEPIAKTIETAAAGGKGQAAGTSASGGVAPRVAP